jgi:hypothetical protein
MIRRHVYVTVLLAFLPSFAWGQDQEQVQPSDCQQRDYSNANPNATREVPCNGISVGTPKVFDNRTLTLMLESLSATLQSQQNQFIDQKALAAAFGLLQGFRSTETNSNLTVQALPLPGQDLQTIAKSGNVDSSGKPLPNTLQTTNDTKRDTFTPQAPTLDTLPAFSGFNPNYGENVSDLLSDQVNLSYQIFNLRLVLERALSDRLWQDGNTRLQTVLGFNVTIDPPRTANDAVAVVEIKLTDPQHKISLVSVLPQEKTYNSAALSTKSNAFGGAAVVKAIQVGYSARKRGQIFYLYRDADTIAYERMTGDPGKLIFGWMFRPVLGRRSVSPGLRQLFAILALPQADDHAGKVTSEVRTYWKKYDHDTQTSFEHPDANRARRIAYHATFGLNRPEIFEARYENGAKFGELRVEETASYEGNLRPTVDSVTWRPAGAKNIVISAHGNNFFSGTQVALGDKTYASVTDGLVLKSVQGFDLTTTIDSLVNGTGMVIGRYGTAVPLARDPVSIPPGLPATGIEISTTRITHSIAGLRRIEIYLRARASDQVRAAVLAAEDNVRTAESRLREVERRLTAAQSDRKLSPAVGQSLAIEKAQAEAAVQDARVERAAARQQQMESWRLDLARIPSSFQAIESPLVSFNGTLLDFPYQLALSTEDYEQVVISANLPDSLVSDGGGVVKVSWPFYPGYQWTATKRFYNPDLAFVVTRVSDTHILLSRVDELSFANGPENTNSSTCWKLMAGDTLINLTKTCTPPKADATCASGRDTCEIESEFVVSAKVEKMPDNVVLVAPSGSTYLLAVPPLKAKDDKVTPIQLKQFDSEWLEIAPKELTVTGGDSTKKAATADLSKLASVEANGKKLTFLPQMTKVDAGAPTANAKAPKPSVKSVKVEITRDLTSKPGTIDVAFLDADNKIIGTRQIQIACTECNNKGDK